MTGSEALALMRECGEADRAYAEAFDVWRAAHPDERNHPDPRTLASWQAEVEHFCKRSNDAMNRLHDACRAIVDGQRHCCAPKPRLEATP